MAPTSQPNLDQSWIVSDGEGDAGNISWADESAASDAENTAYTPQSQKARYRRGSKQHRNKPRTSSRLEEPEFMMPSVESLSPEKQLSLAKAQRSPVSKRARGESRTQPQRIAPAKGAFLIPATNDNVTEAILQIGGYGLEILGSALRKLKQPISWALAAYLFAGMLVLVQNLLTNSISNALSPICRIPGVSYLNIPICTYTSRFPAALSDSDPVPTIDSAVSKTRKKKQKSKGGSQSDNADPEFDSLMTVQSQFSALIDSSSSESALRLPLDMKRSEISIRDLRQIVRYSAISSRNELVHEFDGFIETARIASYDLQKFNSHVGRAVDNVLSTTRWTGRALDDIASEKASRGLIPGFFQDRLLAPFQPLKFNEGRVLEQYIIHSRVVSDEIARLIEEATGLLSILGNLEDRLDVIHGISLRDGVAAKADRDEILSQLWTFLGGNRSKLGNVDNQLKLLGRVSEYRKLAYAHVSTTVIKLQSMGAELEELRSRVAAPEVLRDTGRAVPLDVHLEAIKLGVERLEVQREKAREIEKSYSRRAIDSVPDSKDANDAPLLVDA